MAEFQEILCPVISVQPQEGLSLHEVNLTAVGAVIYDPVDKKVVYLEGATSRRHPPARLTGQFLHEGSSILDIDLGDYRIETRRLGPWTIFWAFDRRFENRPTYDDVLYTVEPPRKEQIEERLRRSPVPILPEWIETIATKIDVVSLVSPQNGRKIYRTQLPDIHDLEEYVGNAAREEMWIKSHGRVPQSETVAHGFFAPERFNLKKWKEFLRRYGGLEKLEALDRRESRAVIGLFELFGPEIASEAKKLERWHAISFRDLLVAMRKGTMEEKDSGMIARGIRILLKGVNDDSAFEYVRGWIDRKGIVEKPWESASELRLILDNIDYGVVRSEKVANCCRRAKIQKELFKKCEDLYLEKNDALKTSSRSIPTIKGSTRGYEWEMIDATDPRWLTVGFETNCCQHLASLGAPCVRYIAENPDSSTCFFVRKKGEWRAVAQSFVWVSKEANPRLVFDNIEYLGKWRAVFLECYRDYLAAAQKSLRALGIATSALIGTGYMDDVLNGLPDEPKPASIPRTLGYSDAKKGQKRLDP